MIMMVSPMPSILARKDSSIGHRFHQPITTQMVAEMLTKMMMTIMMASWIPTMPVRKETLWTSDSSTDYDNDGFVMLTRTMMMTMMV